jgi:hypothetical protein
MSLPVRVTVTAKVEAVTPEGGEGLLLEFLRAYRDAVQLVVDRGVSGSGPTTSPRSTGGLGRSLSRSRKTALEARSQEADG